MQPIRQRVQWLLAVGVVTAVPVQAVLATGQPPGAAATAVLERALEGPAEAQRRAAFTALAEYRCRRARADDRCVALLAAAARHDDWTIRLTALPYAVRPDLPADRCRPAIHHAALRDPSEPVRRAAAKLLSDQAVREDRAVFAALLDTPDPLVREFAAGGLARLGDRQQVGVLRQGLHSQDPELALEAARLLSSLDRRRAGDAAEVLRRALAHRDEVVRANALYVLSELQAPTWSEADVTRALDDPSPLVREAALTVLPVARIAPASAGWPLATLARRWDAERAAELRLDILNAVAELGKRGAVPTADVVRFAELVVQSDGDHRLRVVAEGVLAEHDTAAAAPLLTLAGDPAGDVTDRVLAMSLLGRSCQARVLPALAGLIENPGGPAAAHDALRIGAAAAWLHLAAALEDDHCGRKARAA